MSDVEALAKRIESQAAISAVPGQLEALEQIAGEVRAVGSELEKVREHRRRFGDIVVFTTEHVAAICAELDLSYEAETETVIAAIRRLRDGE